MRRKRIYQLGFFFIVLLVLQQPLSLLLIGKKAHGVVVERVYENSLLAYISGASSSPKVDFYYNDTLYSILGEKDQKFELAERVEVVFYSWNPQDAKILSFGSIFLKPTIELPLGLLIWWALFRSFPNLFDTTITKKQYAKLLIAGKFRKEKPLLQSVPHWVKIMLVAGVLIIAGIFAFIVWLTISAIIGQKLSIQMGVGICLVLVVIILSLIQKIIYE